MRRSARRRLCRERRHARWLLQCNMPTLAATLAADYARQAWWPQFWSSYRWMRRQARLWGRMAMWLRGGR